MISDKKHGMGYSMMGFLAVSLFVIMLIITLADYPGWVFGETSITELTGSDSEKYLIAGGALGGFLLAFSSIGKFEFNRPGRIAEGIFLIFAGIFLVWASIFKYGEDIFLLSLALVFVSLLFAMISAAYDDLQDDRHMIFGSMSVVCMIILVSLILTTGPEIYQVATIIVGVIWIITRNIRELYV